MKMKIKKKKMNKMNNKMFNYKDFYSSRFRRMLRIREKKEVARIKK
jgi:hypothetical protein